MTTTEIALLSTCIGAGAGILTQLISNALNNKTDKKKIKFELISEERKLARMILINQLTYDQSGYTIEYYYKLSVINQETNDDGFNIKKYHEETLTSNSVHAEYSKLIGEYCKNIYKLILYVGHSEEIEEVLMKILNHVHKDTVGVFDNFNDYDELYKAYSEKQKLTRKRLEVYESFFDEMQQLIKKITRN